MSLGDILSYLTFLRSRWNTKFGLALLCFAVWAGAPVLLAQVPLLSDYPNTCRLTLLSIVIAVWTVRSGRWVFPSDKITVGVAFRSSNPEAQKVIRKTLDLLETKLDQVGVRSYFRIIRMGADLFITRDEARRFGDRHKINLLVRGNVDCGNIDDSYFYNLNDLYSHFHFSKPVNSPEVAAAVKTDLSIFMGVRDWQIAKSNDLIDTDRVASNLSEIVLSTMIVWSAHAERWETAISLGEALLPLLERSVQESGDQIQIVEAEKTAYIPQRVLWAGRLRSILARLYLIQGHLRQEEEDFEGSLSLLSKALKGPHDRQDILSAMAIAHQRLGRSDLAEEVVDQMAMSPVYFVDKAYFCAARHDYEAAAEHYARLLEPEFQPNEEVVFQVIAFLSEESATDPHHAAFHFGLAFMNFHFGHKEIAAAHLENYRRHRGEVGSDAMEVAANEIAKTLGV